MKIGVAGVSGRMGRLVADAVVALGAEVQSLPPWDGCLALVDFTHPDRIERHVTLLMAAGTPWVLGTTGLPEESQALVEHAAKTIPVVQAANFSTGVTLVIEAARRLARALPAEDFDAEILDMHHRQKRDSPSGTALALGRAVAEARGAPFHRRDEQAARQTGDIGFAALRGGQVVGEHTLLFAGETEQIFLGHRALDRSMFARGAVRAARWVHGRPPGLYGMTDVVGIADQT